MSLDELGRMYGTDKASGSHDYLRFYEPMLASLRSQSVMVMEMGIGGGGSLRMWKDYFGPLSLVVGFDIEDKSDLAGNGIFTIQGDQSKAEDLDRMKGLGRWHMINDDAGHNPTHQLFAFQYLLPRLVKGGLYLLEDIGSGEVTQFMTRLAYNCVHANWDSENDEWTKSNGPNIDSVSFYREVCAVRMKT